MATSGQRGALARFRNLGRHAAHYLVDRFAVLGMTHSDPDVAVVVRVDGIGDFVVWLEAARALRQHLRSRRIVLVANRIFAALAAATGDFDEVIAVDLDAFEHDLRYRFNMVRRLRALGAATAIQPTFSRRFTSGDAMVRATGAPERIGSTGEPGSMRPWQQRVADRWYTRLIPAASGPVAEFERNCEFLQGLGAATTKPAVAKVGVVAELPSSLRIAGDYFIVFPGAGNPKRMWPAHSFGAAARAIAERYGWRMVVCGSAGEAGTGRQVADHAGLPDARILSGQTSLPEFVELVRGARLLIGNETSAIHIAAAVGTPSVCLLGGGHFGRFMPYPPAVEGTKPVAVFRRMACFGCNWHCTLPYRKGGPVPCIDAIEVQDVMTAIEKCVSQTGPGSAARSF